MKNRNPFIHALLIAAIAFGAAAATSAFADDHEVIESVMKEGHKGKPSLLKKVLDGQASEAEIKKLNDLYVKFAKTAAPEGGDAADWKKRTAALLMASEKVVKGDKAGIDALKQASNCKSCHDVYKK